MAIAANKLPVQVKFLEVCVKKKIEYCYLIHFEQPVFSHNHDLYGDDFHYIGTTRNLSERLEKHWTGEGAAQTRLAFELNIPFYLGNVWTGGRDFERCLQVAKDASVYCLICGDFKR